MKQFTLYEDATIKWTVLGRDPNKAEQLVDTNEYIVEADGECIILDPGGIEVFPEILTAVSSVIKIDQIKSFLCSHQDPDVMSSLSLWMSLVPKAKIFLPWLWSGFVSHFGSEYAENFVPIQDAGGTYSLGSATFQFVPAHHCHSAGNFHFFDPVSGILFSGDLGAALLPDNYDFFVEDFEDHVQYMDGFHRRWMPSKEALAEWARRVRRLNPKMICPQHGAIFKGENVEKFLDWIENLNVGQMQKYA